VRSATETNSAVATTASLPDKPARAPLPGWSVPAALSALAHGVILLGLATRAPLHAAARPPISVEIVRPQPKPIVAEAPKPPEPVAPKPEPKRAKVPMPRPAVAPPPTPTPPPPTPTPPPPVAAPTAAPGSTGGDNAVALPEGAGALTGTQPGGSTTARPNPNPTPPRRSWDYGAYLGRITQRVAEKQRYPEMAIEMGLEGVVEILVKVRRDGTLVERPRVGRSSGHELLDSEAVRMVASAAPFAPLPSDEAQAELRVPVRFHLDN
jgi:TonB family protein